ncbi:MAG: 30S ribosomal protein S21 [Candidatus Izimaplasma sp.]|nr:30S ribosomal protein S21 [Candidatus Izimaplasma bacterium]
MPKTKVKENESIESALRRFKRDLSRSGTLAEVRKRKYYKSKSDLRKEKRAKNQKNG